MRSYRMVATDVSGGTCCPRCNGLLQNNNIQIKIKRCLSVFIINIHLCNCLQPGIRETSVWRLGTLVWFRAGVRKLSLLQSIQTFSMTHPTSYPMATCISLFPSIKLPGHGSDHWTSSSAKFRNDRSCISSQCVFMKWFLDRRRF